MQAGIVSDVGGLIGAVEESDHQLAGALSRYRGGAVPSLNFRRPGRQRGFKMTLAIGFLCRESRQMDRLLANFSK